MKTPLNMLEEILSEIMENTSLLEMIIRNAPDMGETDNALACLVRAMEKTTEKTQAYIESNYHHGNTADTSSVRQEKSSKTATEINIDVIDALDGALLNINKIYTVGSRYSDAVFADRDESEDENCLIIRTLIDFAGIARNKLKTAEAELFK
ncbi:hypothetical protein MOR33_003622 [Salmonella enterica]|nr:hypothetical protein [Salmonella enterica]EGL7476512.1 hypothetical protein [Salmonella enterica]EIZ2334658.1 hypothetical protein [Salmonella enterica]